MQEQDRSATTTLNEVNCRVSSFDLLASEPFKHGCIYIRFTGLWLRLLDDTKSKMGSAARKLHRFDSFQLNLTIINLFKGS